MKNVWRNSPVSFVALLVVISAARCFATEIDHSDTFAVGTTGYQANIPSTALNLLADPGVTFTASQPPNGDGTASHNYATLIDGSFGTVPNSGGGGLGEVAISDNTTLTYTLASNLGYNLTRIDVFSGWGDSGRFQQRYTVNYSTVANPTTFLPIATVAFNPGAGNSAWVELTNLSATNVKSIQFVFPAQQNAYVGYTELAAQGVLSSSPYTWTGLGGSAGNGTWDTGAATNNWKKDGIPIAYTDGAVVVFDGTGINTNITTPGVAPGAISFANDLATPYTFSGSTIFTFGASGSLTVSGAGSVTFNNNLSLGGFLSVSNGTLTLNTVNSISGGTTVTGGTLNLGNSSALGNNAAVTINGGTVNLKTAAHTLPNLSGTGGSIVLGNTTGPVNTTLTLGSTNAATTYGGVIAQATGTTGALVKAGTGVLTLGGASTYTGATTINGGVLRLNTNGVLATGSAVAVNANGSLGGIGKANGAVTVAATGHLAPGINTTGNFGNIGTLTLGSAVLNQNSTLDLDFATGDKSDLVAVTGALTLPTTGSVTVNFAPGSRISNGTYKILSFGSLVNAFSASSLTIPITPVNGATYTFVRNGNEIDLTVVGGSDAGGVFSSAFLGAGDFDATVGLSSSKTYLNAVNVVGAPLTINSVPFTASVGGNPTGTGNLGTAWSITGPTVVFNPGGTNNVTGLIGTMVSDFVYNGSPATFALTGLTVGQTYVITLYNRSWDAAGGRPQLLTASDGATILFDEDLGASGQGFLNLLRYTFIANGTTETITFAPQVAGYTMHFYGFSTEQVFNKTYVSGNAYSTAIFNPAGAPGGAGSNVLFPAQAAPTTFNLDISATLGHMQFDGVNAWTITGNGLTLQTDVGGVSVLEATSGSHIISAPLNLASDAAKLGGGALTLSGGVSGPGGIIVNAGALVLGSSNAYSGATVVNGGTLRLASADALGTAGLATFGVKVNNGGTLDLNGFSPSVAIPATFVGVGLGGGALINSSSTAATYSGDITSGSTTASSFTVGGTGNITLSGAISSLVPLTLIKTGTNTLTLSGVTDNANLILIVNGGTVVLGKTSSANVHAIGGFGTLVNTGGVLKLGGSGGDQIGDTGTVSVNNGGTLDLNGTSETLDVLSGFGTVTNSAAATSSVLTVGANNGNAVYGGVIQNGAGTLAFTKAGSGTFIVANSTNSYSGATRIDGGTLRLGGPGPTGILAHYALDGTGAVPTTAGAIVDDVGAHNGAMNTTGATYVGGHVAQGINFAGAQFITVPDAPDLLLSGAYTVSAWINLASIPANGSVWGILGTRTNLLENTFDMKYQTLNGVTSLHGDIGTGTAWLTTAADFATVLSTNAWHMVTYSVSSTGYTIFLDGAQVATSAFAGTPVFMKTGQTIFIGSDYFAGTQIELMNGSIDEVSIFPTALNASEVAGLYAGGAGKLPPATAVSIATGGALDINGNNQTIASLEDTAAGQSGLVINSLPNVPATLTINQTSGMKTYSGLLADQGVANALSLVKTGAGTLLLTGANFYMGTTAVNGGKLIIDGSLTAGGGAVSVAATAQLRGTGSVITGLVDRTVNLAAGGFIIPGDSVGTLDPKGVLTINTLAPSGTVTIRLSNPAAAQADLVNVTAGTSLDLSAATLLIQSQGGNYANQTLTVFQTTAGNFITGKFGTVSRSLTGLTVQYVDTNNNTVATPSLVTPANRVQLIINGAVTPVTIGSFAARAEGAGVLVSWNCVSEFQNAGFNIYRRAVDGGKWDKVNAALIAGRITNPDPKAYSLYDWAPTGSHEYKLESVSIDGAGSDFATHAGPVAVEPLEAAVSAEGLNAALANVTLIGDIGRAEVLSARFAQLDESNEPRPQGSVRAASMKLTLDAQNNPLLPAIVRELNAGPHASAADNVVARAATPNAQLAIANPSVGARWFTSAASRMGSFSGAKAVYKEPGVLFIPQNMLPAGFNANRLSITREGRALTALAVTSNGIVVLAPGYQDDYTDKDALFLRRTNAPTPAGQKTLAHGLFASTSTVNVETPASVTTEYHDVYFDFDLRPYNYTPWFSSHYLTNGTAQTFTVTTPNASSGAATMSITLWSLTHGPASPDHALQVLVNDQPCGQAVWSGGEKMLELSFQIASGVLRSGANKIDLVTPELPGVASQISLLHSITVDYTRALDGSKPMDVYNRGTASKLFELSNVPNANVWVVDARYADRAALVSYEAQAQADGTYKVRFNASSGGTGRYMVVPAGQENLPIAVSKRQVKPAKAAAYLAVGPSQFGPGVQPLLAARAKEGLRGAFVDQEQIFDYYNYGRYGPSGIQSAVRATRPQYVLLLGRTTYDYRDFSGLHVDPLCPAFLVSTSFWAQATSDSMFGDMGLGFPQAAIGRLPVNNPSELGGAVSHILGNKGLSSGWRGQVVADRNDPEAGDFTAEAESIAQMHPEVAWQRNFLGVTAQTSAEVRSSMKDAANGGADMIIYIGHGNAIRLGKDDPRILETNEVQDWTGNVVLIQGTCTANWMAKNEAGYKSIAIQALTQPQGGISASIASSTYMNSQNGAEFMNQLLLNANVSGMRWGTALMKTQQWAHSQGGGFYSDLNKTEQVFGDPAMPVLAPAR